MKYLLALLFTLLAANAFASKPDSGICPWKIPFIITISGLGKTQTLEYKRTPVGGHGYYEDDTNYWTSPTSDGFEISVDTNPPNCARNSSIQFNLSQDLLRFTLSFSESFLDSSNYTIDSIIIVFAPFSDSIINISCVIDSNGTFGRPPNIISEEWIVQEHFQLSNFTYDDTSIIVNGMSFPDHDALCMLHDTDFAVGGWYGYSMFSCSQIRLSGIFQTTLLSNLASIANPHQRAGLLNVVNSHGSLACSFDVADRERDLELYSPLGIREASLTIPPNESQASLPRLASGIYFVRLEGDVKKLYVP